MKNDQDSFAPTSKSLQRIADEMKNDFLKMESKFQATLKTMDHFLRSQNLVLPENFKEVFFEWFLDKMEPTEGDLHRVGLTVPKLDELIKDRKLIMKWAVEYTDELKRSVSKKPPKQLTIPQIALKSFYERSEITKEKSVEIASSHGYAPGLYLYNTYSRFCKRANRIGKPNNFTINKLENKINLFKSVLELLPEDKRGEIKSDISILETLYQATEE